MEVIRETLWKNCLFTPITPPAKKSNICLSETAYQQKGTRKKCKKTKQAAIIQWQRQCLMDKPHRKPWPKSKTSDISKQSPSPLHHTFLLGHARFTAQPLSALLKRQSTDYNKSLVGEATTTITVRAMNKNQTLLEINAAITATLDSNWSYFSSPSYMKWFITDGIIRCLLYDNFLWPYNTNVCL